MSDFIIFTIMFLIFLPFLIGIIFYAFEDRFFHFLGEAIKVCWSIYFVLILCVVLYAKLVVFFDIK